MSRREFTKAIKLAAWKRCGGHCEICSARLYPGKFEYHHRQEDTFGGEPTLENCQVACIACHGAITGERAKVIAKSSRVRAKHLGIKRKRQGFRGWRRFDGEIIWR